MRFQGFAAALCLAAMLMPGAAGAEVASAGQSAFMVRGAAELSVSPEAAWRGLARIDRWWGGSHTYSGDSRNLRLDLRAGGCWCERWGSGQSVEHARVVLVMEREGVRTLRVVGGLGPLQELGAAGVMTFTVSPGAHGARIEMTYRVTGDPGLELNQLAPIVDQVLMEQIGRFARYVNTGSPQ